MSSGPIQNLDDVIELLDDASKFLPAGQFPMTAKRCKHARDFLLAHKLELETCLNTRPVTRRNT